MTAIDKFALAVIAVALLPAMGVVAWWVVRRPVRGLYLAIFASAILMAPNLPVVGQKAGLAELAMLLTWGGVALWWLSGARLSRGRLTPTQWSAMAMGAGLAGVAVLSFASNNLASGFALSRSFVETINYIYGFLIFATFLYLVDDWSKWRACLWAWMAGAALVAAVGVWSYVTGGPAWTREDFTQRLTATMRQSNQIPSYILPILPAIAVSAFMYNVNFVTRLVLAALVGGIVVTTLGTGSRTGLGLLVVALVGVLYMGLRAYGRRGARVGWLYAATATIGTAVALFAVHTLLTVSGPYNLAEIGAMERPVILLRDVVTGERELFGQRGEQILKGLHKLPDYPLLGVGPGSFVATFRTHEIHNTYVNTWIEQGTAGIFALTGWLLTVLTAGIISLHRAGSARARLLVSAMILGFLMLQMYGVTIFGLRQRPLWFMAGLLAALPRILAVRQPRQRARAPAPAPGDATRRWRPAWAARRTSSS